MGNPPGKGRGWRPDVLPGRGRVCGCGHFRSAGRIPLRLHAWLCEPNNNRPGRDGKNRLLISRSLPIFREAFTVLSLELRIAHGPAPETAGAVRAEDVSPGSRQPNLIRTRPADTFFFGLDWLDDQVEAGGIDIQVGGV